MAKKPLGGKTRVGTGAKMNVDLGGFGYTTHNLSKAVRTTQGWGTVEPIWLQPALPGDSWKIDVKALFKTIPAVLPAWGSATWQVELIKVYNRRYQRDLHNNRAGKGRAMNQSYFPRFQLRGPQPAIAAGGMNQQQIHPSSLMPRLGIRGLGKSTTSQTEVIRFMRADALLMYNEYVKNYHMNHQEAEGVVISPSVIGVQPNIFKITTQDTYSIYGWQYLLKKNYGASMASYQLVPGTGQASGGSADYTVIKPTGTLATYINQAATLQSYAEFIPLTANAGGGQENVQFEGIGLMANTANQSLLQYYCKNIGGDPTLAGWYTAEEIIELSKGTSSTPAYAISRVSNQLGGVCNATYRGLTSNTDTTKARVYLGTAPEGEEDAGGFIRTINIPISTSTPKLTRFPISNIEDKWDELITAPRSEPFYINPTATGYILKEPYRSQCGDMNLAVGVDGRWPQLAPRAGFLLRTHKSDRFNNWMDAEVIDGVNGITELSKIKVTEDEDGVASFSMDAFNFSSRMWKIGNRIAVGAGRYTDWVEDLWGETYRGDCIGPELIGMWSGKIDFEEIVSTAETETGGKQNPLGSLAGRGYSKQSGGNTARVSFKGTEGGMLMLVASIVPDLDYSQGNKWFTGSERLSSMDDMYKPLLGGLGFQNLLSEEMAAWSANTDNGGGVTSQVVGKQPYAVHYMTDQNDLYGDFVNRGPLSGMVFDRRYTPDENGNIKDITTYVDPTLYNAPFAETGLSTENFWAQYGIMAIAKRKMSGQIMPNI